MGTQEIPFKIIYPHAAGIDSTGDPGSRSHLVPTDQNKGNVREFGVYTTDHQNLIIHLHTHGITTIAMESTVTPSPEVTRKFYSMLYRKLVLSRAA